MNAAPSTPELNRERLHAVVSGAIRRGDLAEPTACEACGAMPRPEVFTRQGREVTRRAVQYHHPDDSRPLFVVALCRGWWLVWRSKAGVAVSEHEPADVCLPLLHLPSTPPASPAPAGMPARVIP